MKQQTYVRTHARKQVHWVDHSIYTLFIQINATNALSKMVHGVSIIKLNTVSNSSVLYICLCVYLLWHSKFASCFGHRIWKVLDAENIAIKTEKKFITIILDPTWMGFSIQAKWRRRRLWAFKVTKTLEIPLNFRQGMGGRETFQFIKWIYSNWIVN